MFPIQLPQYTIKPQIMAVYDDGQLHYDDNGTPCIRQVTKELDWEPTYENAQKFMDECIPKQFHHTVDYVQFRSEQPVDKVLFDQAHLATKTDNRLYTHGFNFSMKITTVYWNDRWHTKTIGQKHIKSSSQRTHSNNHKEELFIKS